jgi:hypothetical protein
MPTQMKRTVTSTMRSRRRAVNVQSLRMLVGSGVVRRADCMPPPPLKPVRMQLSDEQPRFLYKEAVREQGWLSRVVFGPKPQGVSMRRSSFDGGQ